MEFWGQQLAWFALQFSFWFIFTGMYVAVSYIQCAIFIIRYENYRSMIIPFLLMLAATNNLWTAEPVPGSDEWWEKKRIEDARYNETTNNNAITEAPKTTETKPE